MTNKTEREAFEAWAHKNRVAANAFHFSIWQAALASAEAAAGEPVKCAGCVKRCTNNPPDCYTAPPAATLSTVSVDKPVDRLLSDMVAFLEKAPTLSTAAWVDTRRSIYDRARELLSDSATASDKGVDLGRTCRRCGHDAHFGSCVNLHPDKEPT